MPRLIKKRDRRTVAFDPKKSVNALQVLKRRYLLKNEKGEVAETPAELFRRVARAVARADLKYTSSASARKTEEEFYRLLSSLEFLPNSPTLMNAGTALGQLSACFVLPVEDSLRGIFTALQNMAIIHQSGGGTGFSFSNLRPRGDIVGSTHGVASGPVSFMTIFDAATDVVKQGGRRRGANMGILRVDHPDIMEFITSKTQGGILNNFNISVAVTDRFMQAVERNAEYDLVNPRTGRKVRRLRAREVFDLITASAWKSGDPGLIFIDEIARRQPTPAIGAIESTNPCGEQPLLPYESCNLGSINLSRMVKKGKLEWEKLRPIIKTAVHFLDNVIDVNRYPLPEIAKITYANRKIGLGVMGFAELLIRMGIPYDSEAALRFGERLMRFLDREAKAASVKLARERGAFPNFKKSIWARRYPGLRNATVTTIAPTGTISIVAGATSGIEPLFAVAFVRNVMEGTRLFEVNPYFEEVAKKEGFYSRELMVKIARTGSIRDFREIPARIRRIFVTALDIDPRWHVRMQAAFQKHTDNAVSKTINLSPTASQEEVRRAYLLSWKLKCKGITVYRYGSKREQVLYAGTAIPGEETGARAEHLSVESEFAGGCPGSYCVF